jgi:hypothetical protein
LDSFLASRASGTDPKIISALIGSRAIQSLLKVLMIILTPLLAVTPGITIIESLRPSIRKNSQKVKKELLEITGLLNS